MKRIKLTLMLFGSVISFGIFNSYGNTVNPGNSSTLTKRVAFEEVKAGDKLYIKSSNGRTLFTEKITKDGSYAKTFDFSNLPENDYYFEVDKSNQITVLPFKVNSGSISFINEMRSDITKPQLINQYDKVLLSLDVDKAQSLEVDIYYEGYDLVYSEELTLLDDLKRIYDFSTSKRGEYLIYIKSSDRVFKEYVQVH